MNYTNQLFVIIILFGFFSCEEVIELDLGTIKPMPIIEANINASNKTGLIKMSWSDDYYQDNDFDKIEGAEIGMAISNGNSFSFNDMSNGKYALSDIIISPGDTISIVIRTLDNTAYLSSVVVPIPVVIDTLITEKVQGGFGQGGKDTTKIYKLTVKWKDIKGVENYYRIKVYRNDIFQSDVYVLSNDALGDGSLMIRPIIAQRYALNDKLRVQLLSVNKAYYNYFSNIANGEGRGLSSPVPFNPKGNIDNALGYMGVWQSSEKILIVN